MGGTMLVNLGGKESLMVHGWRLSRIHCRDSRDIFMDYLDGLNNFQLQYKI